MKNLQPKWQNCSRKDVFQRFLSASLVDSRYVLREDIALVPAFGNDAIDFIVNNIKLYPDRQRDILDAVAALIYELVCQNSTSSERSSVAQHATDKVFRAVIAKLVNNSADVDPEMWGTEQRQDPIGDSIRKIADEVARKGLLT